MKIDRRKKDKNDSTCNICLDEIKLSKDHVPPKGVTGGADVVYSNWLGQKLLANQNPRLQQSQSGFYFQTICSSCNSRMNRGDSFLKELSKSIIKIIESPLIIEYPLTVKTRPNAVIRAILGHLLASKRQVDSMVFDDLVRPCLQDYSLPIPKDIHLYCWIHPFQKTFIIRDLCMQISKEAGFDIDNISHFHFLKFYPLGFAITATPEFEGIKNLDNFHDYPLEAEGEFKLNLAPINSENWPHDAEYRDFLAFGKTGADGVTAKNK